MKLILMIIINTMLNSYSINQNTIANLKRCDLRIDNRCFYPQKNMIVAMYGQPVREYEPNYECGFLSESEQGAKYYTVQYSNYKFTGNSTEGYRIEEILFDGRLKSRVTIKDKELSQNTSTKDVESIFNNTITASEFKVYFDKADDGLVFVFDNNLLTKIYYWSPC